MMNCHEVQESLEMYIAGDLAESESLDVAAHLSSCEECAIEYDRTRELISDLRTLSDAMVPAERFAVAQAASRPGRVSGTWRLVAVAASVVALLTTSALTMPAIARQLPIPLSAELDALEEENRVLQGEVDELKVRLETVGGVEVPIVDTTPGDLSSEVNDAVQTLVIEFVRAQYDGDVESMNAMGTDRLKADIAKHPGDYLRAQGASVVFVQMTEVAQTEDGTYLVFVRLMDSAEWSDSQYQENFEIKRVGDVYLVDFMGMDA